MLYSFGLLKLPRIFAEKQKHNVAGTAMMWFASLLSSHYNGVIAHATFPISSGVIEGVNQKIKTIRRKGYGYPDDEYFFLKIIDASRNDYIEEKKKLRLKPYIHVSVEELKAHMT